MLDAFNAYSARAPTRLLRPRRPPTNAATARLWWRYAVTAVRRRQHSASWSQKMLKAVSRAVYNDLNIMQRGGGSETEMQ